MKVVTTYITEDGKEFDTEEKAVAHETQLKGRVPANIEKFLKCYSGQELMKKHSLDEYGVWEVRGEDPNCDFDGHHHNPYIGTYEGTLQSVMEVAVIHPQFWQWGSGGQIKRAKINKA